MQGKYRINLCSVWDIQFHPTTHKRSTKIALKQTKNVQKKNKPFLKHPHELFIPRNYKSFKTDLLLEYKSVGHKRMQPIKAQDIQHKGFPMRRIKSAQSNQSVARKEKAFSLGNPEVCGHFSNKIINQRMTSEKLYFSQVSTPKSKNKVKPYSARRRSVQQVIPRTIFLPVNTNI